MNESLGSCKWDPTHMVSIKERVFVINCKYSTGGDKTNARKDVIINLNHTGFGISTSLLDMHFFWGGAFSINVQRMKTRL